MRRVIYQMGVVMLACGIFCGTALAQDTQTDTDPALPDPVAGAGPTFPPGLATSGTADPGPTLDNVPSSVLDTGRGSGCTPLKPCAVNSPPVEHLTPVVSSNDTPAKVNTKAPQKIARAHRPRPDASASQ